MGQSGCYFLFSFSLCISACFIPACVMYRVFLFSFFFVEAVIYNIMISIIIFRCMCISAKMAKYTVLRSADLC